MVRTGEEAPEFVFVDEKGNPVSSRSLRGRYVVVYVEDGGKTEKPTLAARAFERRHDEIERLNAKIVRIRARDAKGAQAAAALGARDEKGHTRRTTIVLDPEGKVVDVKRHLTAIDPVAKRAVKVLEGFQAKSKTVARILAETDEKRS